MRPSWRARSAAQSCLPPPSGAVRRRTISNAGVPEFLTEPRDDAEVCSPHRRDEIPISPRLASRAVAPGIRAANHDGLLTVVSVVLWRHETPVELLADMI